MSGEDIRSSLLALRALTTIKTIGELSNVDELRQLWNAKEQPSCVVKTTFGSSLGGYSATTDCCRRGSVAGSPVSPLQTGIPRSTLSKIKQLKIIQLPTIRHFPKSRHPTVASNHCFQYVACGLCNALPHEVVRSSLLALRHGCLAHKSGLGRTLCAISPRRKR